jgi:hypothetical protein
VKSQFSLPAGDPAAKKAMEDIVAKRQQIRKIIATKTYSRTINGSLDFQKDFVKSAKGMDLAGTSHIPRARSLCLALVRLHFFVCSSVNYFLFGVCF